jgi:hypothetical protein
MRKIVFDVTTPYQLLIAIFTCEIFYKQDFTILLINNSLFNDVEKLAKRIAESKLFNQVNIINEKNSKENIIQEINSLNLFDCNIYHFSSYSSIYSCYLFNNVSEKTKIILNEEGIASYNLFENYKRYRELFPSNPCDFIDLNKLTKILFLEKELYISKNKKLAESLDLNKIENLNKFIKTLNFIFDYKYNEIKERNIFFTQNFLDYKVVTEEEIKLFFKKLKEVCKEDIILKLHPFDKNIALYKKLNLKILKENSQTPWEIIVYNHILNKKFHEKSLLTIGSTSLCNTHLFFSKILENSNIKYKLLCDLFNTPFNKATKEFYNNLNKKTNFTYLIIKKFEDLKS